MLDGWKIGEAGRELLICKPFIACNFVCCVIEGLFLHGSFKSEQKLFFKIETIWINFIETTLVDNFERKNSLFDLYNCIMK